MKIRTCLILLSIFIIILITTTVVGALIGKAIVERPRIVEKSEWASLGMLPPGEMDQVIIAWNGKIYVEMVDGVKYVKYVHQPEDEWVETSDVLQSNNPFVRVYVYYRPSSACPRLRPPGNVVAEFCYVAGYGDEIIVVLEEKSIWLYRVHGDDNYQSFKALAVLFYMLRAGGSGAFVGVVITIILFLWVGPRIARNKK